MAHSNMQLWKLDAYKGIADKITSIWDDVLQKDIVFPGPKKDPTNGRLVGLDVSLNFCKW